MKKTISVILAIIFVLAMIPVTDEAGLNVFADAADVLQEKESEVNTDGLWCDFAAACFAGGNGTAEDPYRITSAEEFALLAKLVNSGDSGYASAYYRQSGDIDLAAHLWEPIGRDFFCAFSGNYDGNGFAVRNMKIADVFSMFLGLFGVNSGTVKNLSLKNAEILIAETESSSNVMYAGLLCGVVYGDPTAEIMKYASVRNCEIVDGVVSIFSENHVLCGAVCGLTYCAEIDTISVDSDLSINTGTQSVCVGGAVGAVSSFSTISLIYAEIQMQIENDSSLCETDYHMLHCAGGLFGFVGYDLSHMMLAPHRVGFIYWGMSTFDISISDCNAVGSLDSVHTADGDSSCGQILGHVGVVEGSIRIVDILTEVYLTLSGGNAIDDENSSGEDGHHIYCQHAEYADHSVFRNLIAKAFGTPGYWDGDDHRSIDGFIYMDYYAEENSSQHKRRYISRTAENTYDIYYGGTSVIVTDHFTKDVLWLADEHWQDVSPGKTKLYLNHESECFMHEWDKGEPSRVATCTQTGVKTYTCSVCGHSYTETIAKTGHSEEIIPAVEATCTQTGLTQGTKCAVCGEILDAQTETPVKEHTDADADDCCDNCNTQMPDTVLTGDVDGDEQISSSDARSALRAAVGLDTLTETQKKAADVNKDGEITSSDARLILRCAVGLETF